MTEPIKQCPFCGGGDKVELANMPDMKYVRCDWCDATGPEGEDEDDAILLWNAAANALEAAKAERDEGIEHLKFTLDQRNELDGKLILCEENLANVRAERDMLQKLISVSADAVESSGKMLKKFGERNTVLANDLLVNVEYMRKRFEELTAERDTLLDERNVAVARCAEARTIARRLWREKQKEKYWCKEIKFDEKAVTEALEKVYGTPLKYGGLSHLTPEEWDALVDVRKGTPGFRDDNA